MRVNRDKRAYKLYLYALLVTYLVVNLIEEPFLVLLLLLD